MAQTPASDTFLELFADGAAGFAHAMVQLVVDLLSDPPAGGLLWVALALSTGAALVNAVLPRFDYDPRYVLGTVLRIGGVVVLWQLLGLALAVLMRSYWAKDSIEGLGALLADASDAPLIAVFAATALGAVMIVQLVLVIASPVVTVFAPLVAKRAAEEGAGWWPWRLILGFVAFPCVAAAIDVAGFAMAAKVAADVGAGVGLLVAALAAAGPVILFCTFTRRPAAADGTYDAVTAALER